MGMESRPIDQAGREAHHDLPPAICSRKSNYQDFGRYAEVDLAIAADAEATLPALIEACKRLITPDRKRVFEERGAKLAEGIEADARARSRAGGVGWDASPISTARLSAELWDQIKNEDWSLVSDTTVRQRLAAAAVGLRQALSVHRRARRVRHRLRRAGGGRARRSPTTSTAA